MIEDEEDMAARETLKSKWTQLAKLVGARSRLEEERKCRGASWRTLKPAPGTLEGKAMFVAMSRDI